MDINNNITFYPAQDLPVHAQYRKFGIRRFLVRIWQNIKRSVAYLFCLSYASFDNT